MAEVLGAIGALAGLVALFVSRWVREARRRAAAERDAETLRSNQEAHRRARDAMPSPDAPLEERARRARARRRLRDSASR